MKNLFKTFTLVIIALRIFANPDWTEIPHYKVYPKTPIVDYKDEILDFYSTKSLFGEFSNFALFPIEIDGVNWPSSEHYYQAHKYTDAQLIEWVRLASSPYEAAMRGRDKNIPKRHDWDEVKDQIMEIAVYKKFESYQILRDLLLSTNESRIFEHTTNDCYWGDCGDRTGKNKLGLLLMTIRNDLNSSNHHY